MSGAATIMTAATIDTRQKKIHKVRLPGSVALHAAAPGVIGSSSVAVPPEARFPRLSGTRITDFVLHGRWRRAMLIRLHPSKRHLFVKSYLRRNRLAGFTCSLLSMVI